MHVVETPIPNRTHQQSNLYGTGMSIKLGLNFNHARTNSDMIHVIVLSDKVRRNEWLKSIVSTNSRHW